MKATAILEMVILLAAAWGSPYFAEAASFSPAESAQNTCEAEVSARYLKVLKPMSLDPSPTIESILNRRRVRERYCIEFSQCTMLLGAPESLAVTMRSLSFETCLSDE